jgi:hypothetical protein
LTRAVLASNGVDGVCTAPQAPQMNTIAEPRISSVRRERTDRILIIGRGTVPPPRSPQP